jgi:hypothetical protein
LLLVTAVMIKMTLQLLRLLLMKRIARWRKKARVILLATVTITVVLFRRTWKIIMGNNTGDKTWKPVYVIQYKWLGGISLKDQLVQMYLVERKHMHEWYMNAMIIYRHNTGKQIDQLAFRVNLVKALFQQFADKTKLHGLSPRANYTDRVTAACRRSNCQLLRIEGATWSAWRIPTAVFSVF